MMSDNNMKVAIATASAEKIAGVKDAIFRFFNLKESAIDCYSKSIASGVSAQPFGDETYQGALNRVNKAKKEFPEMDYYISCEAGIENAFGQYFNVHVVCIYEAKSKTFFWGKSAGWSISAKDIEIIRNNNLDSYLRGKGLTCIEELLGSCNSRRAAVAQATELALASGKLL